MVGPTAQVCQLPPEETQPGSWGSENTDPKVLGVAMPDAGCVLVAYAYMYGLCM